MAARSSRLWRLGHTHLREERQGVAFRAWSGSVGVTPPGYASGKRAAAGSRILWKRGEREEWAGPRRSYDNQEGVWRRAMVACGPVNIAPTSG